MAKELPYFKFEPAEYLTKDVSFCSLSAQGLFINICSYYWQRGCKLTKQQLLRRLNYEKELNELISEKIIVLKDDDIIIDFLDRQINDVVKTSKVNSINGLKGGRPKLKKPNESQTKPNLNPNETQTKAIREDKIREDKIREDNVIINNKRFLNELLKDQEYKSITAMQTKANIPTIDNYLKMFEAHLTRTSENKNTLKDFKYHFTNWINKQDIKVIYKEKRLKYYDDGSK